MNFPLNSSADKSDALEQARYNMIEQQIRAWNVYDGQTLDALGRVRREEFVPLAYRSLAFMDFEIPLRGNAEEAVRKGECMLAPKVEARLLQDLLLRPDDRVLEIGAGSGYMAALLAQLADQVVSLEIEPELATMAQTNLQRTGVRNAAVRVGDGSGPIPDGPFDVILLSGSVAAVPQELLALLRDGGRLAAIVGEDPMMRMTLVRRFGERFETTLPWDTVAPRLRNFPEPSGFRF